MAKRFPSWSTIVVEALVERLVVVAIEGGVQANRNVPLFHLFAHSFKRE